jgi:hypothetical protein
VTLAEEARRLIAASSSAIASESMPHAWRNKISSIVSTKYGKNVLQQAGHSSRFVETFTMVQFVSRPHVGQVFNLAS